MGLGWASAVWAGDYDVVRSAALAGSVLKVEAIGAAGGYSVGTAVAIAPGVFVTNCHVTRGAKGAMLVRGGSRWAVEAEQADLYRDLCVLRVPELANIPVIPLAPTGDLRIKQPVVAVGYTGGAEIQMRTGTIRGLHRFDGSRVIQTTTAFTSGASGGALLNAAGQLAGILTFRLRGADGYYFAAPAEWIAERVADSAGFRDVAPLQGVMPFWAQPPTMLPFFMQAASLEVDSQWGALLELTDRWTRAEVRDPESWFMRGTSLDHQGSLPAAIDAFRKSVALDPGYAEAWLSLGRAYLKTGAVDDARKVVGVLRDLDGESADVLTSGFAKEAR